jgi:CSLREA domain-containing protein
MLAAALLARVPGHAVGAGRILRMHRLEWRLAAVLGTAALLLSVLVVPAAAAGTSIIVDSNSDTVADDGVCTLREAIVAANTNTASGATAGECPAGSALERDEIGFFVNVIVIGSDLPAITEDLRVPAANALTIDGGGAWRPFTITSGEVIIQDLIVTHGASPSQGGAISNSGNLTLSGVDVSDSTAGDEGGGVFNAGTLTVVGGSFTGNDGNEFGGGIANTGTLSIDRVTVAGNTANRGGGIYNSGPATILRSTISGNTGTNGAGILTDDNLTIANSTIADNDATQDGGGIADATGVGAQLTLINTTISGNSSGTRGGGLDAGDGIDNVLERNTLIAGNTAPTYAEAYANNLTTASIVLGGPGSPPLADILDPAGLQDNGGPTKTIALVPWTTNIAVNQGDNAICAASPIDGRDQRLVVRSDGACDIGAFEAEAMIPTPTLSPGPTPTRLIPTQSNTSLADQAQPTGPARDAALLAVLGFTALLVLLIVPIPGRRARR